MTPEQYQRVVKIFQEALDRSPDARQAFLAQACVGDDDLQREVESLLAQEDLGGGILSEPLGRIVAEVLDGSASAPLKGADGDMAASESANKNQRPPWWMYVIASSFAAYFGVSAFSTFWGPESIGLIAAQDEGRVLVKSVRVNSPADRAAIQPGDQIVYGAGHPVENLWDWNAVVFNVEADRPIPIQVVRGEKRVEAVLLLNQLAWAYWWSSDGLRRLTILFARFVYLALAFVIAFSRPFDITALAGALFLASAAPVITEQVEGLDATFRRLPVVLQMLLWIAYFLTRFGMGAFFTFFAAFPRVLFRKPWIWALGWVPILALMPWDLHYIYRAIYHSDQPTGSPSWTITAYPLYWLVYLPTGLTMLFLNYRRLTDPNERRRIRVIVTGLAVLVFVSLPLFLCSAPFLALDNSILGSFWSPFVFALAVMSSLAMPASFTYAILRYRLFDIRVIIRQGLQYAAARNALVLITPALLAILVIDLLVHRSESLGTILQDRGWIYISLAVLTILLHVRRKKWLLALDRRFFREQYDAQQILGAAVQEVRLAHSAGEVAPRILASIEAGLHPMMAGIFVRYEREHEYRALSLYPSEPIPIALPAATKFCQLVQILGKPLELGDQRGSLRKQLPDSEIEFLRHANVDWLIPVSAGKDRCAILLAIGPKRSEQPYTSDDINLLRSIADSFALLVERTERTDCTEGTCLECSICGGCYDFGVTRCPSDDAALVRANVPRYVRGRLRLERKIGQGGMGIVYEASDMELHRRVAVKFIGGRRPSDESAVARFRREARALAALQHPNIVTIFDVGSTANGRSYLVMELLRGTTLRSELATRGPLTLHVVTEILHGICAAVDAAHRQSVIHRDLKPENVFLTEQEAGRVPKVLDFGLARLSDADGTTVTLARNTTVGAIIGTPRYIAPERIQGDPGAEAADIWAIGVIAYEMLTGIHPFSNLSGVIVREQCFTPIGEHIHNAPAQWQDFFIHTLAFEPANRPKSPRLLFAEFLQAFQTEAR